MKFAFQKFLRALLIDDESGTTAVEYALMCSVIVIFCLGAVSSTGEKLENFYQSTAVKLETLSE